jgi:hypothetical protein
MKEDMVGTAYSTHRSEGKCIQSFGRKTQERPLEDLGVDENITFKLIL